MREAHRLIITEHAAGSANGLRLLDLLYKDPILNVSNVAEGLGVAYPTANNLVTSLCSFGFLEEITGQSRNRVFAYAPYLNLLREQT